MEKTSTRTTCQNRLNSKPAWCCFGVTVKSLSLFCVLLSAWFTAPILFSETPVNPEMAPVLKAYDDHYLACHEVWAKLIDWEKNRYLGLKEEDHSTVSLDPWGKTSQVCSYVPSCSELLHHSSESDIFLEPLPDFEIGKWIPPTFRWAEYLGLGENRFYWEVQIIDPFLESRGHAQGEGYHVQARLRISLLSKFHLDGPTDLGPRETFRRYVDSRMVIPVGIIRNEQLSDVIHYNVGGVPMQNEFRSMDPLRNAWGREKWYRRFFEHAHEVKRSLRQADTFDQYELRVEQLTAERLLNIVTHVVHELKRPESASNPFLGDFRRKLQLVHKEASAVIEAFQVAGHLSHLCSLSDTTQLLTSVEWENRLNQGHFMSPMPGLMDHQSSMAGLNHHLQFHINHHVTDR